MKGGVSLSRSVYLSRLGDDCKSSCVPKVMSCALGASACVFDGRLLGK